MVMVLSIIYYEYLWIHYADEIAACSNFPLKNDPFFRISMVAVLSMFFIMNVYSIIKNLSFEKGS